MNPTTASPSQPDQYGRALAASKKAHFDIDHDVIRGRRLDPQHKYLPDGLSLIDRLDGLSMAERRFVSQIQGRSYANIFGLVERFISAKVLELTRDHVLGDQVALEALIRFSDEELKHQELFRRIERMAGDAMPDGYRFLADPNDVARLVLTRSTWSILALTCHIELFTQAHYKQSIAPDADLSPLFKDVFLHHFKEESQHAVLDELEWRREDGALSADARERAVDDFLELVRAVDGLVTQQAAADADYFIAAAERRMGQDERARVSATFRAAYRLQYITSGVRQTRFVAILAELLDHTQMARVQQALAPLLD